MSAEVRRRLELMIHAVEHWDLPGIREQVRDQKLEEYKKSPHGCNRNGQKAKILVT